MTPPKYQEIAHGNMGKYNLPDDNGVVEIIAGEFKGVKGPAFTFTPMHVYNVRIRKAANLELSYPLNFNTGILMVEGSANINGSAVETDHFVLFRNDGESIEVTADEDAVMLVLSGEPIDEPIAQYGPFLMNTWQELEQAIEDVNAGKFGVLED
jgi:redox-sensitive bicupin YhaK (pirin superfamily)